MHKKFNNIITNHSYEKLGSGYGIADKNFSNEIIRNNDLFDFGFIALTFVNCNFINIDFRGSLFHFCNFENCTFNQITLIKCQLSDCTFKNCKIVNSSFQRAEFLDSQLIECKFYKVNMAGTEIGDCEFINPKFNKMIHLKFLIVNNLKIWSSNKFIQVELSDD